MQIQFLRMLERLLTQHGRVERRQLVEAPFTNLHPSGIRGLFDQEQAQAVVQLAERLAA